MSADTGSEAAVSRVPKAAGSLGNSRAAWTATFRTRAIIRRLAWLLPTSVAFSLGLWQLGTRSFSQDEAATLAASRRPLWDLFQMLRHIDAVHGAYYVLVHVVISAFGSSETAVRFPSVVATAVAAGAVSGVCARVSTPVLGLAAGLLYAVAPPVTAAAQSARPFALATALVAISYYWFVRFVAVGSRKYAILYCLTLILCGLCDVLAMLVIISGAATIMYTPRYRPMALPFWVSIGVAALLLSPLAFLELGQVRQVAWETPPPLPVTIGLALLSVIVGVALAVFRVGHRVSERAALIALAVPWLLIPPTVLAVAAQITPMWENRYLLFCAPAVAILAVAAIASMRSMRSEAAAIALLVAIALVGQPLIRMAKAPDNLRAVARLLAAKSERGDAVVFPPQASELGRRLILAAYPSDFKNLYDIGIDNSPRYRYTLYGRNVSPALLDRRLVGVKRFWLIESPTRYPPRRYGAAAAPYPFCAGQTWQIPGSTVTLYRRCAVVERA